MCAQNRFANSGLFDKVVAVDFSESMLKVCVCVCVCDRAIVNQRDVESVCSLVMCPGVCMAVCVTVCMTVCIYTAIIWES